MKLLYVAARVADCKKEERERRNIKKRDRVSRAGKVRVGGGCVIVSNTDELRYAR